MNKDELLRYLETAVRSLRDWATAKPDTTKSGDAERRHGVEATFRNAIDMIAELRGGVPTEMTEVYLPATASAPMTELHAWIGHYKAGGHGLLAGDLMVPGVGNRFMPLIHTRRDIAERLEYVARHVQASTLGTPGELLEIELRSFKAVLD